MTFTATGTAGTATQIAVNAGQRAERDGGDGGGDARRRCIVRDANNNPVSGVSVTFAVATGGGQRARVTAATTNASGIATVGSWTLGTTAGAQHADGDVRDADGLAGDVHGDRDGGDGDDLAFTQQPSAITAGATMSPAVTVTLAGLRRQHGDDAPGR